MLETFLLLFIVVHIVLWVLGVLMGVPAFVMVAVILDFITMSASALLIEKPMTVSSNNVFVIEGLRDPFTAFAQFVLLLVYLYTLYEMIDEAAAEEKPKSTLKYYVPMEWLGR